MAKRLATYLAVIILGAALGVASAIYMAGLWPGMKPLDFGNVEIEGWRSDFAIGSETADPYTRARIARHGLLALAKSEAVYFTKTADSQGDPLREACTYRVSGGAMPAQWWSITLYDANSLLPENDDGALSVDATSIEPLIADGPGGEWLAQISPTSPADTPNWISSRGATTFDLTLRLYAPREELLADPESALAPPRIERVACEGDAA